MPIDRPTACIVFANNHSDDVFYGRGFGAVGEAAGELCFNTSMTGYQEIMTDPSYAGQIVAFTFPHIGNVGANREDEEAGTPVALGMVTREDPTAPSNWRAGESLDAWLTAQGRIGVGGVDTRRLTRRIREAGAPHVAVAYDPEGRFDIDALREKARAFPGLEGLDLAKEVSTRQSYDWSEPSWRWDGEAPSGQGRRRKVVAIDYGAKRNILRRLVDVGCDVTVMPADSSAESVMARQPEGVFLSNGPGDPAATGTYAVPMLQELIARGAPIFGICLGHQLLALALGAKTRKMAFGHHGANHPVKELSTGKVEITSMNHGFAVDAETLPQGVVETHVSLFDGTNCGIRAAGKPIFSVQHHPEASPGPQDSGYLFERFVAEIDAQAG
ncbi:MAG: glutamine-hydrolyzing carbamoyl-phosphate synthase small subunit [Rhodobacteraceae bacterium]|nr:glutamine-hydrolyzing carbamoyl-phosphate synthase small subunit [Paracoccaceae bacterium]